MTPARIAVSNPLTPADAKAILDALNAHDDYSVIPMKIRYRLIEWADYIGFKHRADRRSRVQAFHKHLRRLNDKAHPKA